MIRPTIWGLLIAFILSSADASAAPFTPDARRQTLERIAQLIDKNYVFKDVARTTAAEIRGWKGDPALLAAADEPDFAAMLTERLRKKDPHFNIGWNPPAENSTASVPAQNAVLSEQSSSRDNYGFDEVTRLPGNIGYIRMASFEAFDPQLTGAKTPDARKTAEAALTLVQNTDAVIFDIRRNKGGSPAMIDLLLSGFFGSKPVLLNRFYQRKNDRMVDFTTLSNFTGRRRPDVPMFVLISGATGSAAEEFAYDVQTQKRGLLVGETTYGAANPGDEFDAGNGFTVFISTGAAVNPMTRTNWDHVGVKPDVSVAAADALNKAEELALRAILAKGGPQEAMTQARWTLERLNAERNAIPLPPVSARQFAGAYDDRLIAWRDGALFYKNGRFPELAMIPLGGDAFAVADRSDLRLAFRRDPNGGVQSLVIMTSNGVATSHQRQAD